MFPSMSLSLDRAFGRMPAFFLCDRVNAPIPGWFSDGNVLLQARDQSLESIQHSSVHAVAHPGTIGFALNQAGVLEDFEVLRDGGLSDGHLIDQFSADARPLRQ